MPHKHFFEDDEQKRNASIAFIVVFCLLIIGALVFAIVVGVTNQEDFSSTLLSGDCTPLPNPVLCSSSAFGLFFLCENTGLVYGCNTTNSEWYLVTTTTTTVPTTTTTVPTTTTGTTTTTTHTTGTGNSTTDISTSDTSTTTTDSPTTL
jgi:hypothetical protein